MTRANSTQARLAPVAVPSATFLEEMALKKAADLPVPVTHSDKLSDRHTLRKAEALAKNLGGKFSRAVPSKAFLEEQAEKGQAERERDEKERARRELVKRQTPQSYEDFEPISTMTAKKCQIEELRERGLPEDVLSKIQQVPSKAYLEEQEEKLARAPLKSAMKRSGSLKPALRSILKKSHVHDETKAYYSEDELAKSRRDDRSQAVRPSAAPSAPATPRWSSLYVDPAIRAPVHEIHPSTLRPTHSTSTGSTDSAGFETQRSRRVSPPDTRFPASNYIRPYIREIPPEVIHKPQSPTHVDLSWPLVDYEQRRSRGQPLITFDAGFNPRLERYAVRALRPGDYVSSPLSRQESVIQLSETAFVNWIVITCDKLSLWPIQLKQTTNLRVIDIFRAIYEAYAQPLTQEELLYFGRETIGCCAAAFKQRCEDGPELACIAERRGMLRIDLLRGRRIFKGLYPERGKAGHYNLLFDDAPRRS
jgi:hypothetical protein